MRWEHAFLFTSSIERIVACRHIQPCESGTFPIGNLYRRLHNSIQGLSCLQAVCRGRQLVVTSSPLTLHINVHIHIHMGSIMPIVISSRLFSRQLGWIWLQLWQKHNERMPQRAQLFPQRSYCSRDKNRCRNHPPRSSCTVLNTEDLGLCFALFSASSTGRMHHHTSHTGMHLTLDIYKLNSIYSFQKSHKQTFRLGKFSKVLRLYSFVLIYALYVPSTGRWLTVMVMVASQSPLVLQTTTPSAATNTTAATTRPEPQHVIERTPKWAAVEKIVM